MTPQANDKPDLQAERRKEQADIAEYVSEKLRSVSERSSEKEGSSAVPESASQMPSPSAQDVIGQGEVAKIELPE